MAISIRIVGNAQVVVIFNGDKRLHGIRRHAVHTDVVVVIKRNEGKGRIDLAVNNGYVDTVLFNNSVPIIKGCTALRVNGNFKFCIRIYIEVAI